MHATKLSRSRSISSRSRIASRQGKETSRPRYRCESSTTVSSRPLRNYESKARRTRIEDTNRPIRIGGKSIYSENASVSATIAYSEWWKRARNARYIGDETRVSARCKSTGERSGIAIGEFRAKRRIWVRHTVRNTARCRRSLLEN